MPIIFGNQVIGLLSLANRPKDYSQEDQDLLENLADSISPILDARLKRDSLL